MKEPKNTAAFTYCNANPQGKKTTDCVARAISTALDQDYEETARELFEFWLKTGYDIHDAKCYGKYLESKGWVKQKQPRKANNNKYTGKEFVKQFKGTCVAHIGGHHIVCIKDGKILDIWNCSTRCIGNYWTKPDD